MPLATLVLSLVVRAESGELESTLTMLPLPGSATVSVHHNYVRHSRSTIFVEGRVPSIIMNFNSQIFMNIIT